MTQIGSVYGEALYSLALEESCTQEILSQLSTLNASFRSEPDFLTLLSSPNIPKDERCAVLDDSFGKMVHPYILNFLKILTEKGYIRHFSDCCDAYRAKFNQDNGILSVTAVTAVPLSPEQAEKLRVKLSQVTGKTVELCSRVDPKCLGGIRLDYDGKRLDDTVSHRLDAVRKLLNSTVL